MSKSGSLYVYILGYIVVVYCISLWRGVSVNDISHTHRLYNNFLQKMSKSLSPLPTSESAHRELDADT
jgi:hypothetical protein